MTSSYSQAPAGDYLYKAGTLTEGEQLARRWVFEHFGDPVPPDQPDPRFTAGTVRDFSSLGALGSLAGSLLAATALARGLPGRILARRSGCVCAPPPKLPMS